MATAKIVELTDDNICKICENRLGKYTCPKCNILYCSMNCYNSEKHYECSELFYKDSVMKELANQTDEVAKQRMQEILSRLQSNDGNIDIDMDVENEMDSDDDLYEDLAKRLEGVDLDNPDLVWQKLNNDERQEFEAKLLSGDIADLVPKWIPWWNYQQEKKLISDVSEVESSDYEKRCPKLVRYIPDLVSRVPPADCVRFNIVNVLAAYVFTIRYFNGDHFDYKRESVSILIALSDVLSTSNNFHDKISALESVKSNSYNCKFLTSSEENVKCMKDDVEHILNGPSSSDKYFYVKAALSDIHSLLTLAEKTKNKLPDPTQYSGFTRRFGEEMKQNFPKEKLKVHLKKIEYYLSYVKTRGLNV